MESPRILLLDDNFYRFNGHHFGNLILFASIFNDRSAIFGIVVLTGISLYLIYPAFKTWGIVLLLEKALICWVLFMIISLLLIKQRSQNLFDVLTFTTSLKDSKKVI
jgi:hypothetical protein